MVKKLFIFILMFFFIPTISISAELYDQDDNNVWNKKGQTIYAGNAISSDSLFIRMDFASVRYNNEYIYDPRPGTLTTNLNSLFQVFKEFHFYLADNSRDIGSAAYFNTVDDSYYYIDFDFNPFTNGGGLVTIITYYGTDRNDVDMIDFYEFSVPSDYLPSSFFIHLDFVSGTFRFFWGKELFTSNIYLTDFENFKQYDNDEAAYNMTMRAFDRDNATAPIFTSSQWFVDITSDPTALFQYYNLTEEYYNSIANIEVDNELPTANDAGGVFDAFDRFNYTGYTINDTSGMIILYLIILLILFYLIRKISSSSMPMIIVGLVITALFMSLGYLPLFVSIILIGFFIVSIISMNKGGMLVE